MSKNLSPIQLIPPAFVLILQFFTFSVGQNIEATIRIDPNLANTVLIHGKFLTEVGNPAEATRLVLLDQYAGIPLLAKRFTNVRLFNHKTELECVNRVLNEYRCTLPITEFRFRADLLPDRSARALVHTSWIRGNIGILVVDDLMPQGRGKGARISLDVPTGWKIYSNGAVADGDWFRISNIEKTTFIVGRDWRTVEGVTSQASLKVLLTGQWHFSDQEASIQAKEIYSAYADLLGTTKDRDVQIGISDIREVTLRNPWEAGTRGNAILLASSDMPFRSQSLQRLHEQLRHEIFHLWIPNGVNLTGSYDWFYEGFALYESLKMGVAVNRIRFDDYLDTLSRAYAIDARRSDKTSMIEASRNRWAGSNTDVYARGMLVAFLSDLAMLEASKGKRSTTDLLREIYTKHGVTAKPEDGNTAVLAIMKRHPELIPIAERYVTGAEKLEWNESVKVAGIEADAKYGRLSVSAKLSGLQKDLLDKLGYNSWRRLANGK